jgi:hypothetical protein
MKITPEQIASIIHEANRQLRLVLGCSPGPHWTECDQQLKDSVVNGVEKALDGATPQELHEEWVVCKSAQGWTWGVIRDHRHRRHPCLVPYDELPPDQQLKNQMFQTMVRVLSQNEETVVVRKSEVDADA